MGQITQPGSPGITVLPVDRQSGPGAGTANTGNYTIFLGAGAGTSNAAADSIAIGNNALAGGLAATLPGTIAIGVNAGAKLKTPLLSVPGITLIGTNTLSNLTVIDASTIIGANTLTAMNSGNIYLDVIIGDSILPKTTGVTGILHSVLLGSEIGSPNTTGAVSIGYSIIIGFGALGASQCDGINTTTLIGYNVLNGWGAAGPAVIEESVIIGDQACSGNSSPPGASAGITMIGAQTTMPLNTTIVNVTALGFQAFAGASNTIAIGARAGNTANSNTATPNAWTIYIGNGAGFSGAVPAYGFLVESGITGTVYTLLYGEMDLGNLYSGQLPYADRDLRTIGTTNALKLTNGTRGVGNPVGGGFFYCAAGALHWVGTSGTDTTIAPA